MTTHNKISYFGFNFDWKSTYNVIFRQMTSTVNEKEYLIIQSSVLDFAKINCEINKYRLNEMKNGPSLKCDVAKIMTSIIKRIVKSIIKDTFNLFFETTCVHLTYNTIHFEYCYIYFPSILRTMHQSWSTISFFI